MSQITLLTFQCALSAKKPVQRSKHYLFKIIKLLLAAVTYNQVQPLRINYLATEFLHKLEL